MEYINNFEIFLYFLIVMKYYFLIDIQYEFENHIISQI